MSERSGIVRIALRRVSRGGVGKLGDHWLDDGRQVPCFLPDALDSLTSAGLVALADSVPESAGQRRAMLTDAGVVRYAVLSDQNESGAGAVSVDMGVWWVFDAGDSFSHVLADSTSTGRGMLGTMCGRELAAEDTPTFSAPPSLAVCPVCGPSGRVTRPSVVFPTPTHY